VKRTAALALGLLCVAALLSGSVPARVAGQTATGGADPGVGTCTGPVERPADAETVVVAQGLQVVGDRYEKRPALLATYDREARPVRSHDLGERGRFLARSVEETPAGTLVVSRESDHSVVELLDEDRRPVWTRRFGVGDGPAADVDARDALLEGGDLVLADADRLVRYDVEGDRVAETWPLPDDAFVDEESQVSGVAPAADGGYLVTVAGNGTGSLLAVDDGGVRWRVDGLREPHGPQSLGETALVSEMAADRVVELDRDGETRWALTGLERPRSAERLPDGTTLVADRRAHRVVEVDATGRVVWTAFVPWEPVDATRAVDGDRPTAAELNVSGAVAVGGANVTYDELEACEAGLRALGTNRTERALAVADDGDVTPALGAVVLLALAAGALALGRR